MQEEIFKFVNNKTPQMLLFKLPNVCMHILYVLLI